MVPDESPDPADFLPGFAEVKREDAERKRRGEVGVYEVAAMYMRQVDPREHARGASESLEELLQGADVPPDLAAELDALGTDPDAAALRRALEVACGVVRRLVDIGRDLDEAAAESLAGWSRMIELAAEAGANRQTIDDERQRLTSTRKAGNAREPRGPAGRLAKARAELDRNQTAAAFVAWVEQLAGRHEGWCDFDAELEGDRITIHDGRGKSKTVSREALRKAWVRWASRT